MRHLSGSLLGLFCAISVYGSQLPAVRIVNVRAITQGGEFRNASWSPSAAGLLAFIGRDGTYTFDLATRRVVKRSSTIAAPFFAWTNDAKGLVFRIVDERGTMRMEQLSLVDGHVTTLATSTDLPLPRSVSRAPEDVFTYQSDDNIYLVNAGRTVAITQGGGQYFLPRLSPDGTKVLFQDVATGLYVYDIRTGGTTALGIGDDASWAPTSALVVFEVASDDGHNVTASELFVADLTGRRVRLTEAAAHLRPMRPSWSADGAHLAFDAEGSIYVADVIRKEGR